MIAEIELLVACIQIKVLGLHLPYAYKIIIRVWLLLYFLSHSI